MCQLVRDSPVLEMGKSNLKMVKLRSQAQIYSSDLFASNEWTLITSSNKLVYISKLNCKAEP
jgi:hypothetical protein